MVITGVDVAVLNLFSSSRAHAHYGNFKMECLACQWMVIVHLHAIVLDLSYVEGDDPPQSILRLEGDAWR